MKQDTLTDCYQRAGIDFLALKLMGMFRMIRTEQDMARHNDILHDVLAMMGDELNRKTIYGQIAGAILHRPSAAKRSLCRIVADRILALGKH